MTSQRHHVDKSSRLETQIRNPHPVVARLVEKPSVLEVSADERRRALLILHSLTRLAEANGWDVEPASAAKTPLKRASTRDLMSINAGHRPVTVRIRMKQVRIPHEPSESEKRWGYWRRWDYSPGNVLRLEIRDDYEVSYFDDGKRKRVEDHLDRILARIQKHSDDEVEREERRTAQARDAEVRRLEWEVLRARVEHYQQWSNAVEQLLSSMELHERRSELLSKAERLLAPAADSDARVDNGAFLVWAREHLRESDPTRRVRLPTGAPPDMTFEEFRSALEPGRSS